MFVRCRQIPTDRRVDDERLREYEQRASVRWDRSAAVVAIPLGGSVGAFGDVVVLDPFPSVRVVLYSACFAGSLGSVVQGGEVMNL